MTDRYLRSRVKPYGQLGAHRARRRQKRVVRLAHHGLSASLRVARL